MNAGILVSVDKDMLTEVLGRHPRPKNVTNLRHPKVNKEIKLQQASKGVKTRNGTLSEVQNCVEKKCHSNIEDYE